MSETMMKTADATTEFTAKEKVKEPKDKTQDEGPDPYCCTPGDGGGGPDTKP